ncbi:hypothetical protein IID24_05325 [Patescibacteria group bacterium]|nr:hypothetical protein [Patescibacteria group bacterium]
MTKKVTPYRVGWLLSCKAPENMDKGKKLLLTLTTKEQKAAKDIGKKLTALYAKKGNHETQTRLNSHPEKAEQVT